MTFSPSFNNVAFYWRQDKFYNLIKDGDVNGLQKFLMNHPRAVDWTYYRGSNQKVFLRVAVRSSQYNAARVLLEHGARTDTWAMGGKTVLEEALNADHDAAPSASQDHLRMAQLLLAHGADINAVDGHKNTALASVCQAGSVEAAQFLLDRGADPAIAGGEGATLLHHTLTHRVPNLEIIKVILSTKPDVNAVDDEGMTPLFYAREREVARMLLDAGADPKHVDNKGRKAWESAMSSPGLRDFIRNYKEERAAEARLAEEQRNAAIAASMHEGVPLPKTKPLVLKKSP